MSASSTLGETALAAAVALRDDLVASGTTYTVERVERLVAAARVDLQSAIEAIRVEHGVDGHIAVDALLETAAALLELAEEVNNGRARVVVWEMPSTGNAALASFWRYGTIERRGEVVALNHLANPNVIVAGTALRVYER